ncbi:MAG: hypothetical protein LBT80_03360 [Lactobacillaceae bacterium]|jgi:hypothetical protein|nr:hypothetical protein [Lactobacillaceae bacterium]
MKIIGNNLETIHKFRHENISERLMNDPLLASVVGLTTANNPHRLQLLFLDTNETFYLVDNTSSMAHSLIYQDGAIVVREWSPADIMALLRSFEGHGFDNYFQILIINTAEAHEAVANA